MQSLLDMLLGSLSFLAKLPNDVLPLIVCFWLFVVFIIFVRRLLKGGF